MPQRDISLCFGIPRYVSSILSQRGVEFVFAANNDKAFLALAKVKKFCPAHHELKRVSRMPSCAESDPMLKPSISYKHAILCWHDKCDIKFE
jgi:hypothetical protein